MLDNFFVTSPWSDGRSLIAKWNWKYNADLNFFEKARIFYYSVLDEGFERTEIISKPITSFVLQNLRPETTYFICLRVHHRLKAVTSSLVTSTPVLTTTTTTSLYSSTGRSRQPTSPVPSDQYAYEVRCTRATTQNWHLSTLIGGILGVVIALLLGFLLLFVLKRNRCFPGSSGGFSKQMTQRSLLGNSYNQQGRGNRRGRRSSSKRSSFHSNLWPSRSSNSRSEFSGVLREEDEDDLDDDDEVIAEDDEEDTEIDTGCKSSVRSQVGIYGGSGGTTGSSNRHSSMSSSIDAREDSSSVAMPYLPVNGVTTRTATKRSRELKRTSMGFENVKNISGVKVNVVSATPDVSETKEDLQKATANIPTESGVNENKILPPTPTNANLQNVSPPLHQKGSPTLTTVKLSQPLFSDNDTSTEYQSPAPLPDPQPLDLQAPVMISMNCKEADGWIRSPKVEATAYLVHEIPNIMNDEEEDERDTDDGDPDYESSLSLSGSSRASYVTVNGVQGVKALASTRNLLKPSRSFVKDGDDGIPSYMEDRWPERRMGLVSFVSKKLS